MGFSESEAVVVASSQIVPFRVLPGEDASCLNLYQPQKPRILGVPSDLIKRGGFQFQDSSDESKPFPVVRSPSSPCKPPLPERSRPSFPGGLGDALAYPEQSHQ